ncbi:MAG: ATP-binding protein [bacterium]
MVKREMIDIDHEKCTGCGDCIPACPEGALQLIEGKARLVSDLFCDGLGACVGECPEDAMKITEKEAEPYNERKVMEENIIPQGKKVIEAHLKHLQNHEEKELLSQALQVLEENNMENPLENQGQNIPPTGGCPGTKVQDLSKNKAENKSAQQDRAGMFSRLEQWPVQLHLVPPTAPYYREADVVLAADCSAYSCGNFHNKFLQNKSLAIACPKLDNGLEQYRDKLVAMIDEAQINTLSVITMEVPCCRGLLHLAEKALEEAERKIPLKHIEMGVEGEINSEEWI